MHTTTINNETYWCELPALHDGNHILTYDWPCNEVYCDGAFTWEEVEMDEVASRISKTIENIESEDK